MLMRPCTTASQFQHLRFYSKMDPCIDKFLKGFYDELAATMIESDFKEKEGSNVAQYHGSVFDLLEANKPCTSLPDAIKLQESIESLTMAYDKPATLYTAAPKLFFMLIDVPGKPSAKAFLQGSKILSKVDLEYLNLLGPYVSLFKTNRSFNGSPIEE